MARYVRSRPSFRWRASDCLLQSRVTGLAFIKNPANRRDAATDECTKKSPHPASYKRPAPSSDYATNAEHANGDDAWITIRKFPFQDEDRPRWVIEGGTIRRREEQDRAKAWCGIAEETVVDVFPVWSNHVLQCLERLDLDYVSGGTGFVPSDLAH